MNLVIAVPFLFWFTWQLDSGRSVVSFRRGRVEVQLEQPTDDAVLAAR